MSTKPPQVVPTLEDLQPRGAAKKDVIVVGAGMAGLTAAYQLKVGGHRVTLLEARLRPGGRVYSVREPFSDGLYAEAGAMFIPVYHELLMKYVALADLERELDATLPRDLSNFYYIQHHRVLVGEQPEVWPLPLTDEEHALGLEGMKDRYFGEVARRIGDITSPDWPAPEFERYDDQTALELMAEQGASEAAQELLRVAFMARYGDGGRTVSALFMLRNFSEALDSSHAGLWKTIRGGNDRLPAALARLLGNIVNYGTAVRRIEQDETGVTVHFDRAGQSESRRADHVICALPFPCLRRIEIDPPLSPQKRELVEEVQSTSVTHVYLQTKKRFWAARSDLGTMGATDLPVGLVRDATFNQPGERGILDCYVAADDARAIAAMNDDERLEHSLEYMELVMPGTREHIEGYAWKSWDTDEWSLGDYAWYAPGQLTKYLPDLASPSGRLHFAGDQTSPWPAWQEGAIHSGHRAAREVHEAAPTTEPLQRAKPMTATT